MTQGYTSKRGREYNQRCHEGANLERCQKAMRALADLHEQGQCPELVCKLKTKAAILPLVKTKSISTGYYDYRDSGEYRDDSEAGRFLQSLLSESPQDRHKREIEYKEQELRNSNIEGFFPTPQSVAAQMIELAEIQPGQTALEPSAGAGHLAEELRKASAIVTCCERVPSLRELLDLKGFVLTDEHDFLDVTAQFDRIVMNPPFERGQDAAHVLHAYDCLKAGGRLVSIVGQGVLSRSDSKSVAFREWLEEMGAEVIALPAKSFDSVEAFRRTGVSVSIVVVDKK